VGSYHLFRLPEEVEQDLHAIVQGGTGEEFANLTNQNKQAALDSLKRIAGAKKTVGVGPTAVGNIKDLASANALSAIAGAYFSAFSQNVKTYPYLVG